MMTDAFVKLEIFVPASHLDAIRTALQEAGAGAFGNYDSVLSYSPVRGCWRPLPGADPYLGQVDTMCEADEYKIEVLCRRDKLAATVEKVKAAHPYEAPVIQAIPLCWVALEDEFTP